MPTPALQSFLASLSVLALLGLAGCGTTGAADEPTHSNQDTPSMTAPTYTFVSVSTAKEGRFDDLVRIAKAPSELMDQHTDGLLARQVAVDRDRNTVVVWCTFDKKETLYDYLATDQGKQDHGENDPEMGEIIETFEMYDLTPVSGRL